MLHEADPTDLENDPEELLHLEGKKIYYMFNFSYFKKSYSNQSETILAIKSSIINLGSIIINKGKLVSK